MRNAILLTCLLSLCSCGGGGGSDSPFWAGDWFGSYDRVPLESPDGTISVHISLNGTMTGTMHRNSDSADGVIQGTVAQNGQFNATVDFPGDQDSSISGHFGQNGITKSLIDQHAIETVHSIGQDFEFSVELTPP